MDPAKKVCRETDLFQPINDFLIAQGYTVKAEVKDCDVTATKDDDLIIIEIKKNFSVDLLFQAIDRQTMTDSVYMALPGPVNMRRGSRWRRLIRIARRLELGLMAVTLKPRKSRVEILCHPEPYQRRKQPKRKRALLAEINHRTGNHNQGGSVRTKVITAYKENAILIACALNQHGPLSPKQLRELGTGPKTLSILNKNHHQWFHRVERGIYQITPQGIEALKSYPEVVADCMVKLPEMNQD